MAIVRHVGRPDLFVTFTCNPAWPEIKELLQDHQGAHYDPVAGIRILKQKRLVLLNVVLKDQVLGIVAAHVLTIEFQQRGLPHAHILFTLAPESKPLGTEDYDAFVSAEIPDPIVDAQLHAIVLVTMMHGPCSSRCLGPNGRCTKRFLRPFGNVTTATSSGFPMYRRRNDGRFVEINGQRLDKRFVIPFNPLLSKLFSAHVNVEIVAALATHKYIFKYITKGSDYARAVVGSDALNFIGGIDQHIEGQYLSCYEVAWRIFSFPVHDRSHAIVRLHLHLENQHLIHEFKFPTLTGATAGRFDLSEAENRVTKSFRKVWRIDASMPADEALI
jgi:hypothetical protein